MLKKIQGNLSGKPTQSKIRNVLRWYYFVQEQKLLKERNNKGEEFFFLFKGRFEIQFFREREKSSEI